MPNLLYRPRHDPPRWWEHWLAHPTLIGMSVGAVGLAGIMLLSALTPTDWSPAAAAMPLWALLVVAGFLGVGGIGTIAGIAVHWPDIRDARTVVQCSLVAQAVGWLGRMVMVLAAPGPVWGSSAWVSLAAAAALLTELAASRLTGVIVDREVQRRRCGR